MEDEREAILDGLRAIRAALDAEDERHEAAVANLRGRESELLVRARDARVGLKAIARAMNVSRPRLAALLQRMSD